MAVARLAWDNLLLASGVVVTSSGEVTDRPDDNVVNRARWKIWRSDTNINDKWIKFDLGSAKSFQAALLVNFLNHTGGAIRFQAHATDAFGSPTVDETITIPATNPTKVIAHFFSSVQSFQWIRILFANTASANEFVELGVAFTGPYLVPTNSVAPGVNTQRIDPSEITMALDGQESSQQRTKYFTDAGVFHVQTDADKDLFVIMNETIGSSIPFFFAQDADDNDQMFYGRFTSSLEMIRAERLWNIPFQFREVR